MGPHDGRIEHHPVPFGGFQGLKGGFPHAFLSPAAEAAADRIKFAEPLGQVGPRTAGAHYPHGSIEKQPIIFGGYAAIRDLTRQKGCDGSPLVVRDFMTTHIFY